MRTLARTLVAVLLATAALSQPSVGRLPRAASVVPRKEGVLSFLVLGDSGTGGIGQRTVAAAMARSVAESPVDFALMLGDNFYPDGLANESDPLFDRLFVRAYPAEAFAFPFYPVLGNHEYHRNAAVLPKLGRRDVRWRMPARRYAFTQPLGKDSVLFVALDTTAIDNPPRVTPDVDVRPPLEGVEEELRDGSSARWRFAFGHHVITSSGLHGESAAMRRGLAPVLAKGRVDLYLCGHDHILESLGPIDGVPQITSGGGGGTDRATPIAHVRPESQFRLVGGGFVRATITREKATFTFHDSDGAVRHTRNLSPREPAGAKP